MKYRYLLIDADFSVTGTNKRELVDKALMHEDALFAIDADTGKEISVIAFDNDRPVIGENDIALHEAQGEF